MPASTDQLITVFTMYDSGMTYEVHLDTILTVKIKGTDSQGAIKTCEGSAYITRADEPKSKALLHCKFRAIKKAPDGDWEVSTEGDDLRGLISSRLG